MEIIAQYSTVADRTLNEPVAYLRKALPHTLKGPSSLVDAIAREVHARTRADVTIINTGIMSGGDVNQGTITRRAIIACCPSVVNVVTMDLRGYEIENARRYSAMDMNIYSKVTAGFRGDYVGTLVVISSKGSLLPNHVYRVATVNPLALGFSPYKDLACGTNLRWQASYTLRDLLVDVLRKFR